LTSQGVVARFPEKRMIRRSPAHLMRHLVDGATPELVLVSEADFIAAQDVNAADRSAPQGGPVLRRYLLAGLLACGVCGRRMESAWSNGRPAYRCRRSHAFAPSAGREWGYSRDVTAGSGHHGQMGTALVRRRSGSLLVLWFRLVMPGDGA
jgi:hypothetical protein